MMYCAHGRMEPQDCAICQQLELPGVARSADEVIWGPVVLDQDKADHIREVMGQP